VLLDAAFALDEVVDERVRTFLAGMAETFGRMCVLGARQRRISARWENRLE
jgi:hypothetical protein